VKCGEFDDSSARVHGAGAFDPDSSLARVVEAWPKLTATERAAVLAVVEGAEVRETEAEVSITPRKPIAGGVDR
jgi:uncharacterized protein (DUF169 family)